MLNLPVDMQLDLFDKIVTPILFFESEIWAYDNNEDNNTTIYIFIDIFIFLLRE